MATTSRSATRRWSIQATAIRTNCCAQGSIIAKVNELMALCDQLEAHLKAGDIARSRLLDALIAETLDEARTQPA